MRFARLRRPTGPVFSLLEDAEALLYDRAPWEGGGPTGERVPWTEGELLCPVTPSKIVCVGRNYSLHAKELGNEVPKEPLLFMKPPSSLLDPGGTIELPPQSARVEHEAELAVVVGKRLRKASADEAARAVFGYSCAGDITARDLQKSDGQWTRAKGFDTFCPIGPWIETSLDLGAAEVSCRVGSTERQRGRARDMVFGVPALLAYTSQVMTLLPGDVFLTGTPEGVGPLASGDALEIEVSGVGVLHVRVG